MRTSEDHIRFALGQLSICNVSVYMKLGFSKAIVLDIDGRLERCLIKRAYIKPRGSMLELKQLEADEIYAVTNIADYICAVDIEAQMCLLLPVDIMEGKKSLSLGTKYDKYKLTYRRKETIDRIVLSKDVNKQTTHQMISIIKKSVAKDLKSEDLMRLL